MYYQVSHLKNIEHHISIQYDKNQFKSLAIVLGHEKMYWSNISVLTSNFFLAACVLGLASGDMLQVCIFFFKCL